MSLLVTATAGEAGLTSTASPTGTPGEAAHAANSAPRSRVLAARTCGFSATTTRDWTAEAGRAGLAFARVDVEEAAGRLAQILRSVGADVLTVYDPAGGYGHPDHVQVHRVGVRAAEIAATPVVLEATVDRVALFRLLVWLRRLKLLRWAPPEWQPERLAGSYTDPARLTHKVDVRASIQAKRAAMAAYASQRAADKGIRSLGLFLRLPSPAYRWVFGHEWFTERARLPPDRLLPNIFFTLDSSESEGCARQDKTSPRAD